MQFVKTAYSAYLFLLNANIFSVHQIQRHTNKRVFAHIPLLLPRLSQQVGGRVCKCAKRSLHMGICEMHAV